VTHILTYVVHILIQSAYFMGVYCGKNLL